MPPLLPKDANRNPIPALPYRRDGAHEAAVTSTSNLIGPFAPDTDIVTLYATGACYFRAGGNDAIASDSDHYLPAGHLVTIALGPEQASGSGYIAVIAVSGDCSLYVSERS